MKASELPQEEFNPYYKPYIDVLGNGEMLTSLTDGLSTMKNFIEQLPESKINFSYEKGKWSVAQVLMHLIDTERIFQYRALRFYRNDNTALPGFDQDDYVMQCESEHKGKSGIIEEYITVRKASIALFKSFKDEFLTRKGKASDSLMSVRALGFIISGHQAHHLNIIKERYLN